MSASVCVHVGGADGANGSVRYCVREVRAAAADKWCPWRRDGKPVPWLLSHPENTSGSVLVFIYETCCVSGCVSPLMHVYTYA